MVGVSGGGGVVNGQVGVGGHVGQEEHGVEVGGAIVGQSLDTRTSK